VLIEDLAFGGEGVARHEGKVIFIPYTAMGERVRVRTTQSTKSFSRGEIVEVLEKSPDRENPPCPYFGRCGGCQYQHISYEAELRAKQKQLEQLLARIGKISSPVIAPVIHAAPYGYRNRISVHNERGHIGFRALDNRSIVGIEKCLLACDEVNENLEKLRERSRPRPHYSIRADEVNGEVFHQTNRLLANTLKKLITDSLDSNIQTIVEGYSGVGFFTHVLAKKVSQIISIESDTRAVETASRTKFDHVEYLCGTCEEMFATAHKKIQKSPVACLVDPPREGLSTIVRKDLLNLPFDQLLYLSCNPATLARDIENLSPRWKPKSFHPIDMFPRTAHLECLAVLSPL
jgi:23S rRNA (uracil1939-C5)-methyltransferase